MLVLRTLKAQPFCAWISLAEMRKWFGAWPLVETCVHAFERSATFSITFWSCIASNQCIAIIHDQQVASSTLLAQIEEQLRAGTLCILCFARLAWTTWHTWHILTAHACLCTAVGPMAIVGNAGPAVQPAPMHAPACESTTTQLQCQVATLCQPTACMAEC